MTTAEIYRVHSVSATGIPQFLTDLEAENYVLANPRCEAQVIHYKGVVLTSYFGELYGK